MFEKSTLILFFALSSLTLAACDDEYPIMSCGSADIDFDHTDVPLLGAADAPVDLTFFGDFQCPYTHLFYEALEDYLREIEGTEKAEALSVHFRHYPLTSIHNRALPASEAAAAAYLQGDNYFWAMVPDLMTTGSELSDEHIQYYAWAAGLDEDQFNADLAGDVAPALVLRDRELGHSLDIPGTPTVYICGQRASGTPEEILDNLNYLLENN